MNDTFLSDLKQALGNCISETDSIHWIFCNNPVSDFSHDRKISFADYCNFMIRMQSKSFPNEVMDFFDYTKDCSTASAFVQQKYKFLHERWDYLCHLFVPERYSLQNNTYHRYRLLACDGSDVNIARNPDDDETYIHERNTGYNAIHVNALYDLTNNTYCGFLVQGKRKLHERSVLCAMADRYDSRIKTIVLADRGYESFNVFAHMIRNGLKFVIRIKDITSNGILSAYDLPDAEFDTYIHTALPDTMQKRHCLIRIHTPFFLHILTSTILTIPAGITK